MENENINEKAVHEPVTGRTVVIALAIRNDGDWEKIYADLKTRAELSDDEIAAAREIPEDSVVTVLDGDYPEQLMQSARMPFALFRIRGAGGLPRKRSAYVVNHVGSDGDAEYGAAAEETVRHHLGKGGWDIVSSTYEGLRIQRNDATESMWSTSPEGGKKDPKVAMANAFVAAAMCGITVIVSGRPHGKAVTAAAAALNAGRDVFAVPHPLGSGDVCNELIANGAGIVDDEGSWCADGNDGEAS